MSSQHSRCRRIKQKRRRINKKRTLRSYLKAKGLSTQAATGMANGG